MAWPHRFVERPWTDIDDRFREIAARAPEYAVMVAIINSIQESGAGTQLAACTSMFDLLVASRSALDPPVEVVAVRLANWPVPLPDGHLVVEHLSHLGRNDRIVRPYADGVPLFWRFMIEKFGVHPTATGAPDACH